MSSTDQLPVYLSDCLADIAKSEGFVDGTFNIHCAAGSKNGDGFVASIVSVTIRSALATSDLKYRKDLPLVCKLLPDNARRRQFFSSVKLFTREAHFYNAVVPVLKQFQADHGLDASTGFFAFPHCYAARADSASNVFFIVMDDVRLQQYALNDRNSAVNYEHVRLLFEQLGRFHGVSFAMRAQQPELLTMLADSLDDIWLQMTEEPFMRKMFSAAYQSTISMLKSDDHLAVLKRLHSNWLSQWKRCLTKGATDRWSVIGHGDCWNNNLMFRGCDNVSPSEILLLDWQMARFGSPALDLVYFLFTSTDRNLRDHHLDDLLRVYHKACSDLITACGSDAEKLFTFDEVHEQIRQFGVHGFSVAPMIVGIMVSESENITDMDEYANAIDEQIRNGDDQVGHFLKFDDQSTTKFVEKIGAVIDDAIRLKCVEL